MSQINTLEKDNQIINTVLILTGVSILFLGSIISIPIKPIPVSMQDFSVLLVGLLLGSRKGTFILLSYLFLGAIGMPFFAGGSFGLVSIFSPSGGYILGFIPAVFCIGLLKETGFIKSYVTMFVSLLFCSLIIFSFGILWLSHFFGIKAAITIGFYPFIYISFIKIIILTALYKNFTIKI